MGTAQAPITLANAPWDVISEGLSTLSTGFTSDKSVEASAQRLSRYFVDTFNTVVLSRVFLVLPASQLPANERAVAQDFAASLGRGSTVTDKTAVLLLAGTAGREPAWNDRGRSAAHRAIPLVDATFVAGAPMIAALLASLSVEFSELARDPAVHLRNLAGNLNARFFVPDAREARDASGRHIIAAQDFVLRHGIRTVFGMGGAYAHGALAAVVNFTTESLTAAQVDRFPSFIGTFKMATSAHISNGDLFELAALRGV